MTGRRAISVAVAAIVWAGARPALAATTYPLTLADDLGTTVTIARRPARIVSLAPNVTEILFAVGAGDRVVGVTRFCNYPPEAARRPSVAGYTDVNIEQIVALAPDLIVASRGNPRPALARLADHDLTVLAVGPETIDEVLRAIRLIGRATGCGEQADRVCRRMNETLASVRATVRGIAPRRRVYFGSLEAPYHTAGPSSFVGRCIELAGGDNIASATGRPWPILSLETIVARDPEVVIEGFHAAGGEPGAYRRRLLKRLRANSVWSRVTAVRDGRVFIIDDDLIHRPGPRIADAVATLARLLYPERFPAAAAPQITPVAVSPARPNNERSPVRIFLIALVALAFVAAAVAARYLIARSQRSVGGQIGALLCLAAGTVVVAMGSLGFGVESIGGGEILAILFGGTDAGPIEPGHVTIVRDLRLPRIVFALLVGGALAAAGMAMQCLFQNPLADPYIVGVAPGAAVGATLALALGWEWEGGWLSAHAVPIAAFAGSVVVSFLVYVLASRFGKVPVLHLLLFGVALGALCTGITSFILMISPREIQKVYFWLLGSFQDAAWGQLRVIWPYLLIGVCVLYYFAREMDALLLGEEQAQALGVAVERTKIILLATATLLAAAAVAVSGIIGFVGLMVPHMMRLIVGPRHRVLLPASLLAGGALMVLSDTLARSIHPPTEFPVGTITTFLGVPFFIFLLSRKRRYLG